MLISESPNDLSFLDPNNWPLLPPHEFRIYGDDRLQTWAVVDEIDYHFLIQWKWSWKVSNGGKKKYLRRNVQTMIEGGSGGHYVNPETGNEVRNRLRVQQTLFLHTVVMLRKGIAPPSPAHTIVDHLNARRMLIAGY